MFKPDRIIGMASAFYESCVLFTACDAGIFSKIAELGSADAQKLASELQLDERGARLLLDACVALELLQKDEGYYSNTPESKAFLVSGSPGYLAGALRYNRDVYPAWGRLIDFVRSGLPVENPDLHLGKDRERTRIFVMSMHNKALSMGRAVLKELDFAGCRTLLDVGGGPGTFSLMIAQANPDVHCLVIDLPAVIAVANELIQQQDMQEQVTTLAGDYRSLCFPEGTDMVNFFGVLHQESPQTILLLLQKAFASLRPGGIVNVMDMMTDKTHTRPKFSALFSVNMALTTENGWVFSDAELKGWLAEAGFTDVRLKPLPPPLPHSFATARKT